MKTCAICEQEKALFSRHRRRKDGLSSICKSCERIIGLHRRIKNKILGERRRPAPVKQVCKVCGGEKSIDQFNRDRCREGGYRNICRICDSSKVTQWAKRNPEKARKRNADYSQNNPGKERVRLLLRRILGLDKENIKKWRLLNQGLVRLYGARRKKRVKQATPLWLTAIQRAQIQEFYEVAIALSAQTAISHEVDHIFPIKGEASSGLHVPWNLQVITANENSAKKNRMPANA